MHARASDTPASNDIVSASVQTDPQKEKRAMARIFVLSIVAAGVLQATAFGQAPSAAKPPVIATDITAAEIQSVLKAPTGGADRQIKVVDIGKYNVGVGILQRGKT